MVGQREGAATATLNNAGFNVTVDYAESDTVEAGYVISQSVRGERLQAGESVNIVVSTGKAQQSTYTVSASVNGGGGQVSPGSMTVNEGESITFTVTPNSGCTVASVTDTNGKSYQVPASGGTFTVSNVKNNIAVTVTFQETAASTGGGNGSGTATGTGGGSGAGAGTASTTS